MAVVNGWGRGARGDLGWGEGSIPVTVTGVAGTGAVTTVSIALGQTIVPTGVEGTGAAGDVAVADAVIGVTGVSATGVVNIVNVWGLVDDSQTPNYSTISTSQTPSWTAVTDSQTPSWEEVA